MAFSMLLLVFVNRLSLALDRRRTQCGQATAEYALVLLGAAAVALALVSWVGRGRVSTFFDAIFNHLMTAAK
jgi:Flp pilus assembly pilin Flp